MKQTVLDLNKLVDTIFNPSTTNLEEKVNIALSASTSIVTYQDFINEILRPLLEDSTVPTPNSELEGSMDTVPAILTAIRVMPSSNLEVSSRIIHKAVPIKKAGVSFI